MPSNSPYQPKFLNGRVIDYDASANLYVLGENADISLDRKGATWVRVVAEPPAPPEPPPGVVQDGFYGQTHDVALGRLLTLNGFNDSAVVMYFQVYDVDPAGAPPPLQVFRVPAGAGFSWTPVYPIPAIQYWYRPSSTPVVLTPLAENFWLFSEYVSP